MESRLVDGVMNLQNENCAVRNEFVAGKVDLKSALHGREDRYEII